MNTETWTNLEMLFALMLIGGLLSAIAGALLGRLLGNLIARRRGSRASVVVIAGALSASFGGFGILARKVLSLEVSSSVLAAAIAATVFTLPWLIAIERYFRGAAGLRIPDHPKVGSVGRVIVAIPDLGVGSVAWIANGKRAARPARSRNGLRIVTGERVLVTGLEGQTLEVEKL